MTELIGVAAIAVVAWFAGGTIWNVRRGREFMRWMQDGLPALGRHASVRWLGSTAVEMVIREGNPPFAAVTLVIFLEARDLPWMWAIGRLGSRRDTLIIRGTLREVPKVEFEALDPRSWSGRDARERVPPDWPAADAGAPRGVVVHHVNAGALARAQALLETAGSAALEVKRLSVRRKEPHFQLHVPLPDGSRPARDFFDAVRDLAQHAGGG
jgi:hypothetical protein